MKWIIAVIAAAAVVITALLYVDWKHDVGWYQDCEDQGGVAAVARRVYDGGVWRNIEFCVDAHNEALKARPA